MTRRCGYLVLIGVAARRDDPPLVAERLTVDVAGGRVIGEVVQGLVVEGDLHRPIGPGDRLEVLGLEPGAGVIVPETTNGGHLAARRRSRTAFRRCHS